MVDEHHRDLAPIAGVDDARGVDQTDAVTGGEATARAHECHGAGGKGDRYPGGHGRAFTWTELDVDSGPQVQPCIARMLVGRRREVRIQSMQED